MRVFRLASSEHEPLSGEGAARYGGRWNSPGQRLAYTSEHLSLAVLERLVHVDNLGQLPLGQHFFEFVVNDSEVEVIGEDDLSDGWRDRPEETRMIGDSWLGEGRSVGLQVPSAVVPVESNILINPEHRAFTESVEEIRSNPFAIDARLAIGE